MAQNRRLSIAFLMGQFPMFTEAFRLDQYLGLIKLGHKVDVFSLKRPDQICLDKEIKEYDLLNKTYYYREYSSRIDKLVHGFKELFKGMVINPIKLSKFLIRILKHHDEAYSKLHIFLRVAPFIKKKYDLLHAHFGHNGLRYLFLGDILELPLVVSFYGYDVNVLPRSNPSIYKTLFEKTNRVIVLSDNMKRGIVELGCPSEKIAIVHVWAKKCFLTKSKVKKSNKLKLLTVARLVESKGLEEAIRAVMSLQTQRVQIEYKIIGNGPLRNKLSLLIKKLKGDGKIRLLGPLSRDTIAEKMQSADIFLLPSKMSKRGDKEGTPSSIVEASSSGLPVVSTFITGIPEVVIDKKTGFLVREGDVEGLTKKLSILIEDESLRRTMGEEGKKHVLKNYNPELEVRKLENIYHEITK